MACTEDHVRRPSCTACPIPAASILSPTIASLPAVSELGTNPSLEEMGKNYILRVLREANGNQSKASRLLGIDRKTLYLKLKKYGISQ